MTIVNRGWRMADRQICTAAQFLLASGGANVAGLTSHYPLSASHYE
jgi:hypothetical protein